MRVTVAEPTAGLWSPGKYVRHCSFEPIGAEYVASAAAAAGHRVSVLQQRNEDCRSFAARVIASDPDVLGLSAMTYNVAEALRIAELVKDKRPRVFTVIGGYHVSAAPEIVDGTLIDAGVVGEGEQTFVEVLDLISQRRWPADIPGVIYRDATGSLRISERRPRNLDLDSLPTPLRLERLLRDSRVRSLMWPPPSRQKAVAQVTYSRGCPYNCAFCASRTVWGTQVAYRSPDAVVEEIRELQGRFGTNLVFFTDLTFNLNYARTLALCKALERANLEVAWFAMCRADSMSEDLAHRMYASGCTKASFGIDSLSTDTLRRIKAGQQLTSLAGMERSLSAAWGSGLLTRAYFIIGYPWETVDAMIASSEVLAKLPIDDLRISFLVPFPGTQVRSEQYGAADSGGTHWAQYTGNEPLLEVPGASREDLIKARDIMFKTFYGAPEYYQRVTRKIALFPRYKRSFDEHLGRLASLGIIGAGAVGQILA